MKMPIYYTSDKIIGEVGDFKNEKIQISNSVNDTSNFGIGIKGILEFFGINIGLTTKESRAKVTELEVSSVEKFFKNYDKLEIVEANRNVDITEGVLYSFNTSIKLAEKISQKGDGTFIEVSGTNLGMHFSGYTSTKNWCAPSLLENILYSEEISASGLFIPLKIECSGETKAIVQFLVIAHSLFNYCRDGKEK